MFGLPESPPVIPGEGIHESINSLCLMDLARTEELLAESVRSQLALPTEVASRLVSAGGKRIRPFLMSLIYRSLCKSQSSLNPRGDADHIPFLGAVAEWVHTATLFHDDVLDASPTRRNFPAAHLIEGNKVAVLVGDFVYAEAFALLMDRGLLEPSKNLAYTVKSLVEGELMQHLSVSNRTLNREQFEKITRAKTGALFAWCTGTGAWLAGIENLRPTFELGSTLGFAFQIADDLLDTFDMDPNTANDALLRQWCESAPPLPLIVAAEVLDTAESTELKDLWIALRPPEGISNEKMRRFIEQILNLLRRPRVLETCKIEFNNHMTQAENILNKFQIKKDLDWALEAIRHRADAGLNLALENKFSNTQGHHATV